MIPCLLLPVPLIVSANVVWPSLYILSQVYCWYVIVLGLVVEFFAVRFFGKASWGKAAVVTVVMNAISALVGWVLIPVSGILTEFLLLPFAPGTFQLSHWIGSNVFFGGFWLPMRLVWPFRCWFRCRILINTKSVESVESVECVLYGRVGKEFANPSRQPEGNRAGGRSAVALKREPARNASRQMRNNCPYRNKIQPVTSLFPYLPVLERVFFAIFMLMNFQTSVTR